MDSAGLTRGGFYAHFRSKADLFGQALAFAFDESTLNLFEKGHEALTGDAWVRAAARRYLSPRHRGRPEEGCAVPALGAEVARAPVSVRRLFEVRLRRVLDEIAERLGGGSEGRREATVLLSSWVGALVLSRAVADPRFGEEILAQVRAGTSRRAPRAP